MSDSCSSDTEHRCGWFPSPVGSRLRKFRSAGAPRVTGDSMTYGLGCALGRASLELAARAERDPRPGLWGPPLRPIRSSGVGPSDAYRCVPSSNGRSQLRPRRLEARDHGSRDGRARANPERSAPRPSPWRRARRRRAGMLLSGLRLQSDGSRKRDRKWVWCLRWRYADSSSSRKSPGASGRFVFHHKAARTISR
jgi:hypothetical protein